MNAVFGTLVTHFYSAINAEGANKEYIDIQDPIETWGRSRNIIQRDSGVSKNVVTEALDVLREAQFTFEAEGAGGRRRVAFNPWRAIRVMSDRVDQNSVFLTGYRP